MNVPILKYVDVLIGLSLVMLLVSTVVLAVTLFAVLAFERQTNQVPSANPALPAMEIPADNPQTQAKVALGSSSRPFWYWASASR